MRLKISSGTIETDLIMQVVAVADSIHVVIELRLQEPFGIRTRLISNVFRGIRDTVNMSAMRAIMFTALMTPTLQTSPRPVILG